MKKIFLPLILLSNMVFAGINEDFIGKELVGVVDNSTAQIKMIPNKSVKVYVEYGESSGKYSAKSETVSGNNLDGLTLTLKNLNPSKEYFYRVAYQIDGRGETIYGAEKSFATPKKSGENFIFTIQADSHRDENTDEGVYRKTLANILKDNPDFHIDLGDTFMSDKFAKSEDVVVKRYLEERSFLDVIGGNTSLYHVNGNHEGENGWGVKGENSIPYWTSRARMKYYNNPTPNSFFSGNTDVDKVVGNRGGYYSYTWGDALVVVLDPFWNSVKKSGSLENNWNYTLGETQYKWLRETLENSNAKYKFVFSHNVTGGTDKNGRGGLEAANLFEWGGKNPDGTYAFDKMRPGWGKPIHQLLVDNKVDVFFHGHDHFYAKQELDGVIYQLVPQPGHPGKGKTNIGEEYGYLSGKMLPSSGHLRVSVEKDAAKIEYVKPDNTIADSYSVK